MTISVISITIHAYAGLFCLFRLFRVSYNCHHHRYARLNLACSLALLALVAGDGRRSDGGPAHRLMPQRPPPLAHCHPSAADELLPAGPDNSHCQRRAGEPLLGLVSCYPRLLAFWSFGLFGSAVEPQHRLTIRLVVAMAVCVSFFCTELWSSYVFREAF